jgi:hypothetical protein
MHWGQTWLNKLHKKNASEQMKREAFACHEIVNLENFQNWAVDAYSETVNFRLSYPTRASYSAAAAVTTLSSQG